MKQTIKNPILRYRIAVAVLLAALLMVAIGTRQEIADLRAHAMNSDFLVGEYKAALDRLDRSEETARQAQSRLDAIERGVIIPRGPR